jgi:hypothetical protein
MMLLYAVSGTIVVPMVAHALFDLRSLVVIPMAVNGVHRVSGDSAPAPAAVPTAAAAVAAVSPEPVAEPPATPDSAAR